MGVAGSQSVDQLSFIEGLLQKTRKIKIEAKQSSIREK